MEKIEPAEVSEVFGRKVWIESDFFGSKHVMVQHDDGQDSPFCYCSFNYDHRHTSNATIYKQAEIIAESLGAKLPIEHRGRSLDNRIINPFAGNT